MAYVNQKKKKDFQSLAISRSFPRLMLKIVQSRVQSNKVLIPWGSS